KEEFNKDFVYGRRPKVELFWRLGVPGPWSTWKDEIYDKKRRELSAEAGQFGVAGWVARMFSGQGHLEKAEQKSFQERGESRDKAIISALQHIDEVVFRNNKFLGFNEQTLEEQVKLYRSGLKPELSRIVDSLIKDANQALKR